MRLADMVRRAKAILVTRKATKAQEARALFADHLPDDIIMGHSCRFEVARNHKGGHMIAAMKGSERDTCQSKTFGFGGAVASVCIPVTGMVEKAIAWPGALYDCRSRALYSAF